MKKIFVSALVALCGFTASYAQQASFLSNNHCLYRISQESQNQKCLLLPVQEDAEMANIKVIADNKQVKALNVKLAKDHVDYFVPLYMDEFAGLKGLALDIHVNGDYSKEGLNALTCWKEMKFSDAFDMKNREQYRPDFHHTPAYGWMNDPNGMFYKDGVWNLYFQHNPYGSQWENMTWGHSTSTDLVHWKFQGTPIQPDAVGTIFSGSAVVDKNNTSGFGKDAVVALYTSAAENQTQSMAYSTDNGKTFTKYEGNPIITSTVPDFRDPHMFWNEDIKKWNMILAAGQLTVEDGALGPQLCCGRSGFFQLAAAQHDAGLRGLALLGDFGHGLHVVGLTQRSQLGKAALAVPQALVEGEKDDLRRGSFD